MKKYLDQKTVTSLVAFLTFMLREEIIELTNLSATIIFFIIGGLLMFGYTIENLVYIKDKLKASITKKEKPPSDVIDDVIIGDTDDNKNADENDIKDIVIKIPPKADD